MPCHDLTPTIEFVFDTIQGVAFACQAIDFVIIRRSKIFLVLCNRVKDKFSKGLRGILRNSELYEFRICGIDGLLWARTIVPAWIVSSVTMSRFHLPVSHIRATLYVTAMNPRRAKITIRGKKIRNIQSFNETGNSAKIRGTLISKVWFPSSRSTRHCRR